jgi:hypothetical protein
MMKVIAALMIVLALLIGLVPQFTDCEAQGRQLTLEGGRQIPMKCHWTARAELGLALPLLATGVVMGFSRRKESLRNMSILGGFLGITAIMLPTALIGVCGNPDMVCNSTMKPFLTLTGSAVIAVGVVGIVLATTRREEVV